VSKSKGGYQSNTIFLSFKTTAVKRKNHFCKVGEAGVYFLACVFVGGALLFAFLFYRKKIIVSKNKKAMCKMCVGKNHDEK